MEIKQTSQIMINQSNSFPDAKQSEDPKEDKQISECDAVSKLKDQTLRRVGLRGARG